MAAPLYPIALDLTDRPCLVIGGGPVAERKVSGLLDAGARVTVVSPTLTSTLRGWTAGTRVTHIAREYRAGDLAGVHLAFVATNNADVTARVVAEAHARNVWVNAADDPEHCDFHLPALLRRGDLVVAVATGGASPALARLVRDELERSLCQDYALLADVAGEVRRALRRAGVRATGDTWVSALRGDVRRLVAEGRRDDARAALHEALEAVSCR